MPPIDSRDLDEVCEQTESLWNDMRGQRIFVTGGTGFFGCWLLESFAAANQRFALNAEVIVLCRSPETFTLRCPHLAENPAISLLRGDVRSFRFPEGEFPFVIHAAADTREARNSHEKDDAVRMISSIFDGTRNTLEFAASHKTRKFLMISSGAVYGVQPAALSHLPESYQGGPVVLGPVVPMERPNVQPKLSALSMRRPPVLESCKIARCFALVGPHLRLDGSYAIGNFIQSVLTSQAIRIHGDGTPLRSYLYATDLTVWLLSGLLKAPSLQPINIRSSHAISIRELAAEVKAWLKSSVDIEILGRPIPGRRDCAICLTSGSTMIWD